MSSLSQSGRRTAHSSQQSTTVDWKTEKELDAEYESKLLSFDHNVSKRIISQNHESLSNIRTSPMKLLHQQMESLVNSDHTDVTESFRQQLKQITGIVFEDVELIREKIDGQLVITKIKIILNQFQMYDKCSSKEHLESMVISSLEDSKLKNYLVFQWNSSQGKDQIEAPVNIGNWQSRNSRFLLMRCVVLRMNQDRLKLGHIDVISEVIGYITVLLHFFKDQVRNKFKTPDSINLVNSFQKLVSLSFNLCAVVLLPIFEVALESLVINPTLDQVKTSIRCLMLKDVVPSVLEITELLLTLDAESIPSQLCIKRLIEIKSDLCTYECDHSTADDDTNGMNHSVDYVLSIIGLVVPGADNVCLNPTAIKAFVTSLRHFSAQVETLEKLCISLSS